MSLQVLALTAKEQSQLQGWIDQAREHEDSMIKCAETLSKIKDSGYWRSTHDTWLGFCEDTFSFTRRQAYEWIQMFRFTQDMKRISETSGESVQVPKSVKQARKLFNAQRDGVIDVTSQKKRNLSSMSAKKDPSHPISFTQLKPEPPLEKPIATRVDLRFEITQAVRELDSLLHRGGFEYEVFTAIKHCLAHLTKAQSAMQQMLPGMEIADGERAKARGTQGEIENFCVSLGLPAKDGEICYNKWKGNGWVVGKQAIKCWKSTIRSWFAAGYMPSQRLNGQPKPETLADQSRRKIRQIVNEGLREVTP